MARTLAPDFEVRDCGYDTECWVWLKYCETKGRSKGYPKIQIEGRKRRAHRWYYETWYEVELSRDEHLDHKCENRSCVNPEHLEVVTELENHHRRSKITQEIADRVRALHPLLGTAEVAATFEISPSYVHKILSGKCW
jgi:HNH endonuclease